ncbi:putative transposase [Saccharopolyspora erythraea NRRL 2338]|nr:putative transposase [Saccharopolyspora erythraea NRRL 2338]
MIVTPHQDRHSKGPIRLYTTTAQDSSTARPRRYPTDTTDAEWALIEPLLPTPACETSSGGHPEQHPRRDVVDAIRYVIDNGCKWRGLPADFPPWQTVSGFYNRCSRDNVVLALRDSPREQIRTRAGRHHQPSAGIIDSQSVRAAETAGRDTRGYDAGKKVNGRKRHITTDTLGLLLGVCVTGAHVTDRRGAELLLRYLRTTQQRLSLLRADAGYAGRLITWADTALGITLHIVRKITGQIGSQALPRRWVVERTLSWITQARRTVRDYERLPAHSETVINWAAITLMTRQLTHQPRSKTATQLPDRRATARSRARAGSSGLLRAAGWRTPPRSSGRVRTSSVTVTPSLKWLRRIIRSDAWLPASTSVMIRAAPAANSAWQHASTNRLATPLPCADGASAIHSR